MGDGLVVAARSVGGTEGAAGVVEGLELPGRRFVVAVQWHPEETGDLRLFRALAAAASKTAPVPSGTG